jgi:hypothetical protein
VDWSSINRAKLSEFENDARLVKLYRTLGRTGEKLTNNGIKPAFDFFFCSCKSNTFDTFSESVSTFEKNGKWNLKNFVHYLRTKLYTDYRQKKCYYSPENR